MVRYVNRFRLWTYFTKEALGGNIIGCPNCVSILNIINCMISEQQARDIVHTRADNRCEMAIPTVCQSSFDSIHHRLKRSHGGTWDPANLLGACGTGTSGCHGYVESHPDLARSEGYWLMAGDGRPSEVAVHIRWGNQRSWWYLDSQGMLTWLSSAAFEDIVYNRRYGPAGRLPKSQR